MGEEVTIFMRHDNYAIHDFQKTAKICAAPPNLFFGPGPLNIISRPRGPSKQVANVFNCIWRVFCKEFACGNG